MLSTYYGLYMRYTFINATRVHSILKTFENFFLCHTQKRSDTCIHLKCVAFGARLWHYAAELHTLSVTYPLCGSALTNTTDNPSEMCPLKLTDFCLFSSSDHTQSYRGHFLPQWLSQVAMTRTQTCYPQMGEPAF